MTTPVQSTLDAIVSAHERVRAADLHVRHLQARGVSPRKQAAAKREERAARAALRTLDAGAVSK